jgi:hypothetical protein
MSSPQNGQGQEEVAAGIADLHSFKPIRNESADDGEVVAVDMGCLL